jgi:hypothetical protein
MISLLIQDYEFYYYIIQFYSNNHLIKLLKKCLKINNFYLLLYLIILDAILFYSITYLLKTPF